MLAVSICGPGQLELVEVARPTVVNSRDAVVMVSTAGLGPVDIERFMRGDVGVIPGGEFCGTVVELGADVRSVDLDDLVFATTAVAQNSKRLFGLDIDGGHAEYVLVPEADSTLAKTNPASEERSLLAGGSLGLGATAAEMAIDMLPVDGRVAVIGCDPCGLGALVWLRKRGIDGVIVAEHNAARMALAKRYGAVPFDLRELGRGVEVVVIGQHSDGPTIESSLQIAGSAGSLVICRPSGLSDRPARFEGSGAVAVAAEWPGVRFASTVAAAIHSRRLDLFSAVSHVIPFDDAQKAYALAAGPEPGVQKILLKL